MTATHTQGEWFVSHRHIPITLNDHPDQSPQFDSVEVRGLSTGGGIALVHQKPGHGNPNAYLIAAAPDFYEAADMFVRWIDTYGCSMDQQMLKAMEAAFGAKLRAAIAKTVAA